MTDRSPAAVADDAAPRGGADPAADASAEPRQQRRSLRRRLAAEFARFLAVGGVNTLVAYGVYIVLLHWLRYEIAYSIGYAAGIATGYALSAVFVFRQPMRRRSALRFPLVYAVQFLLSLGALRLAIEVLHLPDWIALGVAVLVTAPVTFALSRLVLRAG